MPLQKERNGKVVGKGIPKGFAHGLGQIVTVIGGAARSPFPKAKSPAEALKGDWSKLGVDMLRASEKVLKGGSK